MVKFSGKELRTYTNMSSHFIGTNFSEISRDKSIVNAIEENQSTNGNGKTGVDECGNEQ